MSDELSTEAIGKHYLEQCMSIKKEIYDLLAEQYRQEDKRKNQYISEARDVEKILEPFLKQATEIKDELKSAIKTHKKELKEEFIKLSEQYELGAICINTVTKRMDDLEAYIKNERFHDLVKEINDLENKFEQEAIKLVQNRMGKK